MPVSKTERWVDWALQQAERLPGVGSKVANYRQERIWNNPDGRADPDRWMTKVAAENDRLDRINGDPGDPPRQQQEPLGPAPDTTKGFHYIGANDPKPLGWGWEQAPVRPGGKPDFATMIADSLQASGIDPMDTRALWVIANSGVYLHAADPLKRSPTPTPKSISAEWKQLGITEEQANEMLNEAIGYIEELRQTPTQVADVAGDATLAHRLTDEDPRDILDDVKRQVHEQVFGPHETEPKADVDRFISALTYGLKKGGYTVREVAPEQDNGHDR